MKFQRIIFIFIIITAVSWASPDDIHTRLMNVEGDPLMEMYLRETLENFREQMKEGVPSIKMPRLDPLELRNLTKYVEENMVALFLHIRQATVRGLSLFNITDLRPNLEHLYLSVNLTLPEIYINGSYFLDGRFVKIFPVYGSGRFEINATGICIAGKGQLNLSNQTLEMSLLKLDLLWNNITMYLENFLTDGDFSQVLQRVIPGVGRDVFVLYKPIILKKLEAALTKKVNEKLNDPAVKAIIEAIYPDE